MHAVYKVVKKRQNGRARKITQNTATLWNQQQQQRNYEKNVKTSKYTRWNENIGKVDGAREGEKGRKRNKK